MTTNDGMANEAKRIVELVEKLLGEGRPVYLCNSLRAVKLTKKNAGAVTADGAGIRVYGRNFMPIGTFTVKTEAR